ncbi:hypothetical protein AAFF_G00139850 [Aldrovandia affinis]|uniref:Uncharacterized protein n=1 Tax=Aldrovandia affinis TaxID=143900 RepID=A0AAD7TC88_9TELE|nr:hypothetical protein AAFF_G00139850 [Aldrovandia affinis]
MNPKEYLRIHTLKCPDCCTVGQGDVAERGKDYGSQMHTSQYSENSTLDISHLSIPVNSGNNRLGFHKQATGLMPKVLVKEDMLKAEENEVHRNVDPQATMSLEQINLFLHKMRELQRPAQPRHRIATSTPLLLSNELDGSDDEFNASDSLPNAQYIIRSMFKDREKLFGDLEHSEGRRSSMRENHKDVINALEEKLQYKELELQQMVQLLLTMQQELEETRKQSDLKVAEIGLLAEKLKLEGKKYKENAAHFDHTCGSLKGKLLTSKADNRTFVKQLRELLEKYEKLKRFASAAKKQSFEDLADKQRALKSLEEAKQEREQLYTVQRLLKEQEEAALRAVSDLKEKLQSVGEDRERNVEEKQRLEDEASEMKREIKHLRDQLYKKRNESRRLTKHVSSVELEKEAGMKQLQESRAHISTLKKKLDEYRVDKESTSLQIKEMRHEAKRNQDKLWAETLLVQDYKACQKTAEGLQKEVAALSKLVLDLKQDKCLLKKELEELCLERKQFEEKNQRDGERFKGVIASLETERNLLLAELGDLRQDYLTMSDRIAQRMGHVDQDESHACVHDYVSICEEYHPDRTATVSSIQSKEDDEQEARE